MPFYRGGSKASSSSAERYRKAADSLYPAINCRMAWTSVALIWHWVSTFGLGSVGPPFSALCKGKYLLIGLWINISAILTAHRQENEYPLHRSYIHIYYTEKSVLLGTKPLIDSICHFIRDPNGVFSVCHLCECRIVQWSHDSHLLLLLNWFLHIIERTLHVGAKVWILCSRGKNNISRVSEAHSWDIVLATRT